MVRDYFLPHDAIRPGFLSKLDPRTKFFSLAVLLISVFSAVQLWRLCILSVVALLGVFLIRGARFRIVRRLYAMRWILCTGLLLHLFSGTGSTIMGVSFLSLNGLLDGGLVVWRLTLAVVFASLFCVSTPVPVLAASLVGIMRPFRNILPVNRLGRHALLVLIWVPIVQDEIFAVHQHRLQAAVCRRRGLNRVLVDLFHMIDRLLVTAENLVETVMVGDHPLLNLSPSTTEKCKRSEVGMVLMSLVFLWFWFWGLP